MSKNETDETTALESVGGCVVLLLATPFSMVWSGWVLSVLWGWFVVPLGLPPLALWAACGVRLVTGSLTHQIQHGKAPPVTQMLATAAI